MKKPRLVEKGLSGSEIINRLRKGHVVRRSEWMKNFYIRICNEDGFDEEGNAVFNDRKNAGIYTMGTIGFFMHLGFSSQPFANPTVYRHHRGQALVVRDGDGIGMLFADDWEDYGFMERSDFDVLTEMLKDGIRAKRKAFLEKVNAVDN